MSNDLVNISKLFLELLNFLFGIAYIGANCADILRNLPQLTENLRTSTASCDKKSFDKVPFRGISRLYARMTYRNSDCVISDIAVDFANYPTKLSIIARQRQYNKAKENTVFGEILQLLRRILLPTGFFAGSSYPKPLSAEEEAECLQKMKQGSRAARDKLICHNMRLVAHIAKKYAKGDSDDLISIGSIGLIKGVESYSCEKGTGLATYLARCIENEILMALRSNKRYQNTVSLSGTLGQDSDGNEYTLMDVIASSEESVFAQAETAILRQSLLAAIKNQLSEREQVIVLMRYGLGDSAPLTQLETAKKLGISRSYVSRIETRALKKLKKHLEHSR